jgi:hypothetical protein
MDRRFLSRPEVIAAARQFVCVRLTTYENKEEAELLKSLARTRSGELENTVFAILSPDGKRTLVRAGRSARSVFRDAAAMAAAMERIAGEHPGTKKPWTPPLPVVANVRLALNVAACDNQPLVLVFADKAARRRELEARLAKLAWGEKFSGRFIWASTSEVGDLKAVTGVPAGAGLLVIGSDRFGGKGRVLAHARGDAADADLARTLDQGAARHERAEKTFRNHVREGQQLGVFWETQLPVSDPMEQRARERGRKRPGS